MKIKKILLGLGIGFIAAMTACSSDDLVQAPTEQVPVDEQGNTYLTISINSVGDAGSRANDEGLEYGLDSEQTVATADFYFYDGEGNFVTKANVWNGGDKVTVDPVNNFEFKSKTVIVLKGLSKQGFPKYLVTILNQPANFTEQATLAKMEEAISSIRATSDQAGNFVMTTTSYAQGATMPYFVTEITDDKFVDDAEKVTDPVEIYVERLATKVRLTNSSAAGTVKDDGSLIVKLETTVAGANNQYGVDSEGYLIDKDGVRIQNKQGKDILYIGVDSEGYAIDDKGERLKDKDGNEIQLYGEIGDEFVYLKVSKWALNAIAKNSKVVKNLPSKLVSGTANPVYDYDNTPWGDLTAQNNKINNDWAINWNDETNKRSYWGKSLTYNIAGSTDNLTPIYEYLVDQKTGKRVVDSDNNEIRIPFTTENENYIYTTYSGLVNSYLNFNSNK